MDHIGGDGMGTVYVDAGVSMDLASSETKTFIQSSLYITGQVSFPQTVYAEQTVTMAGNVIGVEHWYSRGHTKLLFSGQSKCTVGPDHRGQYFFNTFTGLSDSKITFADDNYNSTGGLELYLDTLHLEGRSHGYVNRSCSVSSRVLEIERGASLDGVGRGYGVGSGPGAGCTNWCGSGGGHGGSGASCTGCSGCAGGAAYDR